MSSKTTKKNLEKKKKIIIKNKNYCGLLQQSNSLTEGTRPDILRVFPVLQKIKFREREKKKIRFMHSLTSKLIYESQKKQGAKMRFIHSLSGLYSTL